MPVQYQQLNQSQDVTTTKTILHEVIPITGSVVSGTYGTFPNEDNIKNYAHGMFQSVYDYPFLSSSANHIFDITVGYDEASALSSSTNTQNAKKINLYNQHAQVLLGYTGSTGDGVRKFESDLSLDGGAAGTINEAIFINFSRLVVKDQIKKGSFSMTFGTGSTFASSSVPLHRIVLSDNQTTDTSGSQSVQGGEYGVLFSGSTGVGNIFYQAGIAVVTASIFGSAKMVSHEGGPGGLETLLTGSAISASCDAIRHRIVNISFNNSTEINSKIYFCRAAHNKFNYSSNPTYVNGSQIRVKDKATDTPVAYITTVGLYSNTGELLATAKLSEPLRKDPTNELTLRVRLDY
tara:strand:- start:10637 stop:11683 length:1047 start_codon:yes stop_codon:yes gene_type:complete